MADRLTDDRLQHLRDGRYWGVEHSTAREMAAELLTLRARVTELEAAQPYREVWSDEFPPGGMVCSACGVPVESEPCGKHSPLGYVITTGHGDDLDLLYDGMFSTVEEAHEKVAATGGLMGPAGVHAVVRQAVTG